MRQRWSLLFGLIAVGLAVISSLTPSTRSNFLFEINSKTENRINIPLARHSPDSIKLDIACPAAPVSTQHLELLSTAVRNIQNQGLFVYSTLEGLEVVVGSASVDELKCGSIFLMSSSNETKVFSNGELVEILKTPIRVSTVVLNQDAIDLDYTINAEIVVRGSETTNGIVRWTLWIVAIMAFLGLMIFSRPAQQEKNSSSRLLFFRPDLSDIAFSSLLIFWAFAGPIYLDDGWVTLTSRLSAGWNNYFTIFQTWDARVPIGTPQYLIYHLLTYVSQNLIVLRVIPAITIFIGWRCIRSIMTLIHRGEKKSPLIYIFVVYSSFSMSWLMTIRPEPFVSTLSLLSLHHVLRFQRHKSPIDVLVACIYSGLSLGIHTSGAVAITPLFYAAWVLLKDKEFDVRSRISLAIKSASVLIFIGLSTVFLATDLTAWRENGRLFEQAVNQLGVSDEIQRYRLVISGFPYDSMLRRTYLLLIGLCLTVSFVLFAKRRLTLGFLLVIGPTMFLLITPTKWPWHFGSTVGLVSVSLLLLLSETAGFKIWSRLLFSSSACLAMFFITKSPEAWGFFFPSSQANGGFKYIEDVLRNPLTGIVVIVLILAASVLFPWQSLRKNTLAITILTPLVIATLLPLSFGVRDFGNQSSIASMNLRSMSRPGLCGLGSNIQTPDLSTAHPLEEVTSSSTYLFKTPGGYLERYISPAVKSDFLVTPWLKIPKNSDYVVLPITGNVTDTSRLEIQFATDITIKPSFADTTIRQSFIEGSRVILGPLKAPKDSTVFRMRVRNENFNKIGFPKEISMKSLTDLDTNDSRVQVDPYFKPLLPCIGDPASKNGLAMAPDFMVGDNPLLSTSPANILVDTHDLVFSRAYLNDGVVFPITWILPLVPGNLGQNH